MFFFLFLAKVNVRFIKSLSTFYRPNSPIFARAWSRDEREKMNIEIVLNFLTPVSAHYHTTERRYYEKKSITTSQQQQKKSRKTRVKREEKKVPTEKAEKLDVESCWAGQVRSVALVPHCNFLVHIKQKLDEDVEVALTTQHTIAFSLSSVKILLKKRAEHHQLSQGVVECMTDAMHIHAKHFSSNYAPIIQ